MFDVTPRRRRRRGSSRAERIYDVPPQPTTEAGIHVAWRGDLYVVLGDEQKAGGYAMRIYFNPLVRCIWLGARDHVRGRPRVAHRIGGCASAHRAAPRRIAAAPAE